MRGNVIARVPKLADVRDLKGSASFARGRASLLHQLLANRAPSSPICLVLFRDGRFRSVSHVLVTSNAAFPQKDARSKTGQESVERRTFPAPRLGKFQTLRAACAYI